MKNSPCVLTLDFGTQSVRAALINKKGNVVRGLKISKVAQNGAAIET